MSTNEKTIFTVVFAIFEILVWFASNRGNDLGLPRWLSGIWACPGLLFNSEGQIRKYVKPSFSGFFLFWTIVVWVFA